jgi:cyanophycinase-like exopeptidase
MTAKSAVQVRGSVYLAASHHKATFKTLLERAVAAACSTREARARPYIAVSYAAADGPLVERMSSFLHGAFGDAEVQRFTVKGERRAMAPDKARAIVDAADVVFLGGGDPVAGARLLVDAGADEWLRAARARGAACVGMSAGAIMLCSWWADWPEDAPDGESERSSDRSTPDDAPHDGGELVSCTRVVPDLVVDCHAEHDKWEELKLVRGMLRDRLGDAKLPRFVGLPTGTGVIVGADGSLESVGGALYRLS